MTADNYLIFLTRYSNIVKAMERTTHADMKLIWKRKLEQLIEGEKNGKIH